MRKPDWALGRHHNFTPATRGIITCADCERSYEEGTLWRSEIDPCADGQPTGLTEEEAKSRARTAATVFLQSIYGPIRDMEEL